MRALIHQYRLDLCDYRNDYQRAPCLRLASSGFSSDSVKGGEALTSSRCPKYLPGKGKGVVGDDREGTETKSGNQKGREKGVQGGDIE